MIHHIALISEHASPLGALGGVDSGGQNVYVGQVARHLARLGYAVDVFTRRDSATLPEILTWEDGVRVVQVPAGPAAFVRKEDMLPLMPAFTAWMLAFCDRENIAYDLVHANFWMSGLVAADFKVATGTPFVITFHALGRVRRLHQGAADGFPEERIAIEERIVAEADRIVAECPQDAEDLITLYGADPARLCMIPCGFDPDEFAPMSKPLARAALGLAPDERILLQLGRMVPRKGVDTAIRGLARLVRDHGVPARLLVVGGESDTPDPAATPEIGRLQALAEAEGVADRVVFVGRRSRDQLKIYYSASDVFLTTPWYEPFGITPVEAMACGTPVVGANVGGIKFTVRDGETGYLVPPNDPAALAARLAHLYAHPALMQVLQQQAIRRANDLFTWARVAEMVGALYEEVLAVRQPAAVAEALAVIDQGFDGLAAVAQDSRRRLRTEILAAARLLGDCLTGGGRVLIVGNGGSAADAQHFAAECVGRFKAPHRKALPVMALTCDTATLTAWANDIGYEQVFARQVEAFGRPGDVLIGISTSGRSPNVVAAFETARAQGLRTVGLLGRDGGALRALSDVALVVPSPDTQHIQEIHLLLIHQLCDLIETQVLADQPAVPVAAHIPSILELAQRRKAPVRHPAALVAESVGAEQAAVN